MAISRAQLAKELEPGLNSLFGLSYDEYNREYEEIFSIEDSNRAFEEEVLITDLVPHQRRLKVKALASTTHQKVTVHVIPTIQWR